MRRHGWLLSGMVVVGATGVAVALRPGPAAPAALTVPVGLSPWSVAVDATVHRAFVANTGENSLSVMDTTTGAVLQKITVVALPTCVIADSFTHRAFAMNANADVSVVDTSSATVLRTLTLASNGGNPVQAVYAEVNPESGLVLITLDDATNPGTLTVLSAASGAILRQVRVGSYPVGTADDGRTGHAFVANNNDGTVSMIDVMTGRVLRAISVSSGSSNAGPWEIAIDEQRGHVFVSNANNGTVSMLDSRGGTVLRTVYVPAGPSTVLVDSHTARAFVSTDDGTSVLDTRTGTLLRTVAVGPPDSSTHEPEAMRVDVRSDRVYAINPSFYDDKTSWTYESVSMLDARSGRVLERWRVGNTPVALAVDEQARRLVVVNQRGGSYSGAAAAPTQSGPWAWASSVASRWLPWLVHPAPRPAPGSGTVTILDTSH